MTSAGGAPSAEEPGVEHEVVGPLRRALDDATVSLAIALVKNMALERLEEWEETERKGPGGRPVTFSTHALLVAMTICVVTDQPLELTHVTDVLFGQLKPTWRAELDVPDPPAPGDVFGWRAAYRCVRTRLHSLLALMDPSPLPRNRRRDDASFQAVAAERRSARSEDEWARRAERLEWFVNQVIEASTALLPRDVRRAWKGSTGVDATFVPSFARRPKRPRDGGGRRKKTSIVVHSVDPDAGQYEREADDRDADEGKGPKRGYGYEATLAVAAPEADGPDFPSIVVGMAVLHRPGVEPGVNGVRALDSVRRRGHPAHWLAADRAYSSAKAEDFQLPVRSLGYRPVYDYKVDQLGVKASTSGFNQVEGCLYCPMLPRPLVDATVDLRTKRIDDRVYNLRLVERQHYRARPKTRPNDHGDIRAMCPAAGPNPVVRCPLKPRSLTRAPAGSPRVVVRDEIRDHPPACCSAESVTIYPEAGAKFAQDLSYGSLEWRATYNRLRNATEGANGFVKDPAHEALADAGRRRVHGVAAQSVFVAFLVLAANVRRIRGFMEQRAMASGRLSRLSSRRRAKSLSDWLPAGTSLEGQGRGPPSSG